MIDKLNIGDQFIVSEDCVQLGAVFQNQVGES